jgi:hypothetical protein
VTSFPSSELDQALVLWPAMIDWDFVDHGGYCRHLEMQLRRLKTEGFDPLAVSPVRVQEYLGSCQEVGAENDSGRRQSSPAR